MANNKKVEKLLDQKNKIEGELRKIRKECNHTQKTIKQIQLGEGMLTDTRWVCDDCKSIVGYPSKFDINKFLNKEKKQTLE
jgi:hypothetical protein